MNFGREIITLQFGHHSNFIGAHWWNLQEAGFNYDVSGSPTEINHDVLYREGINNVREVTFTPRALVVDLSGSLGHLKQEGDLYDDPVEPLEANVLWPADQVEIIVSEQAEKNEFLQHLDKEDEAVKAGVSSNGTTSMQFELDSDINVWSDFLKARFHPRTVLLTSDFKHKDERKPFNSFTQGLALWNSYQFEEDWSDRCRLYIEECDNMQGFQVLLDAADGFSGLACNALQYLNDEYSSKATLTFPVLMSSNESYSIAEESLRIINSALMFAKLNEYSSLTVPVSCHSSCWREFGAARNFSHVNYDVNLAYHSGGILASFLETISLFYRRRNDAYRLSNLCSTYSPLGRKVVNSVLAHPFPIEQDGNLMKTLEQWEGPLWSSLTPHCQADSNILLQAIAVRGISKHQLLPKNASIQDQANPVFNCKTAAEMFDTFLSFSFDGTSSQVISVDEKLSTSVPYPNFYSEFLQHDGSFSSRPRPTFMGVEKIPTIAGVQSSAVTGEMLALLHSEASNINLRRFSNFTTSDLEIDDYKDSLESLLCLSECYVDNFFV